jgi:hypothetical protein
MGLKEESFGVKCEVFSLSVIPEAEHSEAIRDPESRRF